MRVRRAGRWAMVCAGLLALSACRPPAARTAPAPMPTPDSLSTASAPSAPPAPLAALDLTDLGLRITPAEGWARRESPGRISLLPSDPQPVVLEQTAAAETPLLVLAKVAEANLGEADPAKAPTAILAGLRKSLDPGLTLTDATAPPLGGITGALALRAVGAYPALGLKQATATFIAGLGDGNTVYLFAGFAPGDAAQKAIDTMLASLAPLAAKAEAEAPAPAASAPTASAPAASASTTPAPAPAPEKAPAPAAKSPAPSSSKPSAPTK